MNIYIELAIFVLQIWIFTCFRISKKNLKRRKSGSIRNINIFAILHKNQGIYNLESIVKSCSKWTLIVFIYKLNFLCI
jgi:hypothetical protein